MQESLSAQIVSLAQLETLLKVFLPAQREELVESETAFTAITSDEPYATAVHNCFCGCGLKVVTPISPVGWKLTFDGESATLFPSIGSWSFPCRSHYFVRHDTVVWDDEMSQEEIEWGRSRDRNVREEHFEMRTTELTPPPKRKRFWNRFKKR